MANAALLVKRATSSTLKSGPLLSPLLAGGKVYNRRAPTDADFDYITLAGTSDLPDDYFDEDGDTGVLRGRIFTRHPEDSRPNDKYAYAIFGQVKALLHNKQLAIAGITHLGGTVTLIDVLDDPTDPDKQTLLAPFDYRWLTESAA